MRISPILKKRCHIWIAFFDFFACTNQFIPICWYFVNSRFLQKIHICDKNSWIYNNRKCILSFLNISKFIIQIIFFFLICKILINICQCPHIDIIIKHFHIHISNILSIIRSCSCQIFLLIIIPRNDLHLYLTIILFSECFHFFSPEFLVGHFRIRRCKRWHPKCDFFLSP